MTKLTTNKKIL